MLYKDSQKLEKTRKHRKPMPHNQGVVGSCPTGTTKKPALTASAFCLMSHHQYGSTGRCFLTVSNILSAELQLLAAMTSEA